MDKVTQLQALKKEIEQEDMSHWMIGNQACKKISDYTDAFNDCVTPRSKIANNVNSEIVIVLQDWSSQDDLKNGIKESTKRLGYDPTVLTNKLLHELLYVNNLNNILNLDDTYDYKTDNELDELFSKIYITNIFPFIKPNSMSSDIPETLIQKASKFIKKEIEIIKPKLVICCGRLAFDGLFDKENKAWGESIEQNAITYFKQFHPAAYQSNKEPISKKLKQQHWYNMMRSYYSSSIAPSDKKVPFNPSDFTYNLFWSSGINTMIKMDDIIYKYLMQPSQDNVQTLIQLYGEDEVLRVLNNIKFLHSVQVYQTICDKIFKEYNLLKKSKNINLFYLKDLSNDIFIRENIENYIQ